MSESTEISYADYAEAQERIFLLEEGNSIIAETIRVCRRIRDLPQDTKAILLVGAEGVAFMGRDEELQEDLKEQIKTQGEFLDRVLEDRNYKRAYTNGPEE